MNESEFTWNGVKRIYSEITNCWTWYFWMIMQRNFTFYAQLCVNIKMPFEI